MTTTSSAPRTAGEYVIFYCTQTADDHDDPCCLCGEDAVYPDIVCTGGPRLGLLDRGPLCESCAEREPKWVQHMAAAVAEIDRAAMYCPPALHAGMGMSIIMLTKGAIERWAEWAE